MLACAMICAELKRCRAVYLATLLENSHELGVAYQHVKLDGRGTTVFLIVVDQKNYCVYVDCNNSSTYANSASAY
jgi:hypothetical protein